MENFGKFITVLLGIIITSIINGFVFLKLWLWFIVPTFQMQPLRLVEAIGIVFLIGYLKKTESNEFWKKFFSNLLFVILMSGFILFFGWIISLFF